EQPTDLPGSATSHAWSGPDTIATRTRWRDRHASRVTMMRRTPGASGISVSAIGLGRWGMSGSYGPADEAESVATLHHALDLGVNFIDTADSYGEDGHSEALIGRTQKDRRHQFVLATKTGWVKRTGPDGKEPFGAVRSHGRRRGPDR